MQDNIAKEVARNKFFLTIPYLNQQRTQKFLNIVLTLLALSIFGFFAINPTISTILKLQKELSDNQFIYDQLDIKIKNLSILRNAYANLQNDLPVVINAIPNQPEVSLLFAQIQGAAQQANVKITKLQNSEVEILSNKKAAGKQYYSYSFSVSGNGSLDEIYAFTSTLTGMQRVTNIDVFSINNTSSQGVASLGFDIQGTAFFKE